MAYQILPADETLLAEIETWLDIEEANYQRASEEWEEADYEGDAPVWGFRCNWDSAKRGWREGRSKIHCLFADGRAVGFLDGTDAGTVDGAAAALFTAGIAARTKGPIVWCLTRPDLFFPALAQVGRRERLAGLPKGRRHTRSCRRLSARGFATTASRGCDVFGPGVTRFQGNSRVERSLWFVYPSTANRARSWSMARWKTAGSSNARDRTIAPWMARTASSERRRACSASRPCRTSADCNASTQDTK
jgi:hypothetical protein